jgi:hypothetical protein
MYRNLRILRTAERTLEQLVSSLSRTLSDYTNLTVCFKLINFVFPISPPPYPTSLILKKINKRRLMKSLVVGLERSPLSLVRIIEELFQGNSGSGLENRN